MTWLGIQYWAILHGDVNLARRMQENRLGWSPDMSHMVHSLTTV